MASFTHYKIVNKNNEIEVILFMDPSLAEFAEEIGAVKQFEKDDLEKEAKGYVKKVLPHLKVSTVKVMVGAMIVTVIGMGSTFITKNAAASSTEEDNGQEVIDGIPHTVASGDTLWLLALRYNTTVQNIKTTNRLTSDLLRIGQTLIIPVGTDRNSAPPILPENPTPNTYEVKSGDTLSGLAKRYGTTVDAIKRANELTSDLIRVGQLLTIPVNGNTTVGQSESVASGVKHTVVSGDMLTSLAKRYGTTVDAIKRANGLTSDLIRVGQVLTVPVSGNVKEVQSQPEVSETRHIVVSGDMLTGLAKRYGTTVDAIKQANGLTSDLIRIGQVLIIPVSSPPPTLQRASTTPINEPTASINEEELEWLAKMIYSEARGESLQGQIAVGAVIMNRVKSPLFPNNIKEVLFEVSQGHYQFTPAQTGSINRATPTPQNYEAARMALAGQDPTNGALYFYNPSKTSSQWLRSRTVSTRIGNHTFAY